MGYAYFGINECHISRSLVPYIMDFITHQWGKFQYAEREKIKKKQSRIVVIDLGRHQPKENSNQDSNQEMFLSNAIKHGGHSGCTVFLRTAVWSQP